MRSRAKSEWAAAFGTSFEGPLHARLSHGEVVAMVDPGREFWSFGSPRQYLADNQKMLYYEDLIMRAWRPRISTCRIRKDERNRLIKTGEERR
jgi:hypothetical protein